MTQKALLIPVEQGEWALTSVPIPEPGPKEVLVRIEAAALNPVEWKVQKHGVPWLALEYPLVMGSDGTGIVEKVGAEVTDRVKGDRMYVPQ